MNIGEGLALRTTGAYVNGPVPALKSSATVRIANREAHAGDTLIQPDLAYFGLQFPWLVALLSIVSHFLDNLADIVKVFYESRGDLEVVNSGEVNKSPKV